MDGGDLRPETLTFLFTDIEGSTRLLQTLGGSYSSVLEQQASILRAACVAHGGHEMGSEGDALFLSFASASGAVAAAADAQRQLATANWPEQVTVRVRMGIHTGEAVLTAEGHVGIDLHRVARITSAGHGGQVLVSATTRPLVEHSLPEGVTLRDLGEHRLKDLAHPEHLSQLVVSGLPGDFQPLRTLDATPNNLPTQLTSFVGRDRELGEARRLLADARLLTLTGPGGTGKTRLALQLAADVSDGFRDGVFFVPLAPVTDSELVASAVVQALDVHLAPSQLPADALREYLRGRCLLLVLDNFEQVLAAAPFVADLLHASPEPKVVVTSRAALRVYGEQEMPVPPLGLPDPDHLPDLAALSQYEAVALFIARARAVKPDFSVTNSSAPAIAEICARLDGLPLAIELAAARVKILNPQAMLDRIERRLPLLAGGSRDLPERQQTLRAAIAWSYDLLDAGGRRLLARLGVFAGGWTLDEAERVCGPSEEIGSDLLDALTVLVDHSLVRQGETSHGEVRFSMLETIREFALDALAESGEEESIRRRHAEVFGDLAERARPELTGKAQVTWLDRLDHEHDNIRAAIDWATARGDARLTLRIAAPIWRFWHMRGHIHEGLGRLERALALPAAHDDQRAREAGLEALGGLAYWLPDLDRARLAYEESLALARELGDPAREANALYNLGHSVGFDGDWDAAVRMEEKALEIYRGLGDREGIARLVWGLGTAYYMQNRYEPALELLSESLAISRELDDRFGIGWALHMRGAVAVRIGDLATARESLAEALRLFVETRDVAAIAMLLHDYSVLADVEGDRGRAARLAAASANVQRTSGSQLPTLSAELSGITLVTREDAEPEWDEGARMSLDEAVAYALGAT